MVRERNSTYIQYRVLRSHTPEGHIHKNNFSNGDQRVLTLTLLPFAAYRLFNEHQYGNNEWHFQIQTHQAEDFSTEAEKQHSSYADYEIAGCTIKARDDGQLYHIFAVGSAGSYTP